MSLVELISASVFVTAVVMVYVLTVDIAFRARSGGQRPADAAAMSVALCNREIGAHMAEVGRLSLR